MRGQKGFTLVEMVVVLIIVGIAAACLIPNLVNSIEQTNAQAAKNNLLAIAAAESKFYEDYGFYCTDVSVPSCAANAIATLSLTAVGGDTFAPYKCVSAAAPSYYTCTATDNTVKLQVTSSGQVTCPIGGASCPS